MFNSKSRKPFIVLFLIYFFLSPNTFAQDKVYDLSAIDVDSVRKNSAYWMYGWSALDVASIYTNWRRAEDTTDPGRRASAKAQAFRAFLGLSRIWWQPLPFYTLNEGEQPSEADIQKQQAFARGPFDWKYHLPMVGFNVLLAAWVADKGDDKYAEEVLVSGLFWGEVSIWSQRMVDTNWQWRFSNNRVDLTYRF